MSCECEHNQIEPFESRIDPFNPSLIRDGTYQDNEYCDVNRNQPSKPQITTTNHQTADGNDSDRCQCDNRETKYDGWICILVKCRDAIAKPRCQKQECRARVSQVPGPN